MPSKIPVRSDLSGTAAGSTAQNLNKEIYKLKFMKGTLMDSQLLSFSKLLTLPDAVDRAKLYCKETNKRFVFLEPAITNVEIEDDGGFIE